MRAFAGVFPPPTVARDIHAALHDAAGSLRARWIAWENLHVTLAFLGEIPTDAAAVAAEALRKAAGGEASFPVRLGGLGAFPNLRRARVAFLKVAIGAPELTRLSETFQQRLPAALRPDDPRPFHAHLTLTRLRQPPPERRLAELAARLDPLSWSFTATEARLVESVLGPGGARYEARAVAPFGAPPGAPPGA